MSDRKAILAQARLKKYFNSREVRFETSVTRKKPRDAEQLF